MRSDIYIWNNIRIKIKGEQIDFISGIKKYLNSTLINNDGKYCDIEVLVYGNDERMLPPHKPNTKLRKSITLNLEKEFKFEIFSHGEEFWYSYGDLADYWMDLKANKIIISLHKHPFSFQYYNILIFFLYPLGLLLENFGYYRIHSSCIDINGRSVLITGQSGSGKSTSAFALASNGCSIISDDLTFVKKADRNYSTHTITRLVKLHYPALKRFFPELLKYGLLQNDEKEVYFYGSDINKDPKTCSILDSIIILEKISEITSRYERIHPSKVITHLLPSTIQINNGRYTRHKFDFLMDMLNEVPCYKVYFGSDMDDFSKNIHSILKKGLIL